MLLIATYVHGEQTGVCNYFMDENNIMHIHLRYYIYSIAQI